MTINSTPSVSAVFFTAGDGGNPLLRLVAGGTATGSQSGSLQLCISKLLHCLNYCVFASEFTWHYCRELSLSAIDLSSSFKLENVCFPLCLSLSNGCRCCSKSNIRQFSVSAEPQSRARQMTIINGPKSIQAPVGRVWQCAAVVCKWKIKHIVLHWRRRLGFAFSCTLGRYLS